MFTRIVIGPCLIGAILWTLRDHATSGEPPPAATPVAELQRLASSVGVWNTAQRFRPTPGASPFESTSTEKVRWSDSKQYLISEQRGLTPTGWTSKVLVTSWNPTDHQIHVVEVSLGGFTTELTLWFEGDVQKILGYRRFGERLVRTELTVEHTSPDEYKFHSDCTDQGKTWVCSEGISKRVKK
ncbi:MAG: hypothetical protein ACREFF_14820 [Candidatus Udaeobacter sp.]